MLTTFYWGMVTLAPRLFSITETSKAERKVMYVRRIS